MIQFSDAYIDGLVQDCSDSSALAMASLQSCTKPLIYMRGSEIRMDWTSKWHILTYSVNGIAILWKKEEKFINLMGNSSQ